MTPIINLKNRKSKLPTHAKRWDGVIGIPNNKTETMKTADEEIETEASKRYFNDRDVERFMDGAKWMRDQMQSYADQAVQEAVQRRDEWVDVDERLPKRNVNVLIHRSEPFHIYDMTAFQRDGIWYSNEIAKPFTNVTHWQPLPQPPSASSLPKEPDQFSILEEVKRLRDDLSDRAEVASHTCISILVDELTQIINKHQS